MEDIPYPGGGVPSQLSPTGRPGWAGDDGGCPRLTFGARRYPRGADLYPPFHVHRGVQDPAPIEDPRMWRRRRHCGPAAEPRPLPDRSARVRCRPPQSSCSTTGTPIVYTCGTAKSPEAQGAPREKSTARRTCPNWVLLAGLGDCCCAAGGASEPDVAHACRSRAKLEELNGHQHQAGMRTPPLNFKPNVPGDVLGGNWWQGWSLPANIQRLIPAERTG
ncbi:hypothetical protein NDU88_001935 [Pleurodeles waltl]|uniref:Uncharacterized protein n=1 Tax=Pleurodeles waltl TaxID=8319 RepID=A0AAV7TKK4_PLEWA|nr:hypothetical protein NDU88_001935 [Pleurodeles waltl]